MRTIFSIVMKVLTEGKFLLMDRFSGNSGNSKHFNTSEALVNRADFPEKLLCSHNTVQRCQFRFKKPD